VSSIGVHFSGLYTILLGGQTLNSVNSTDLSAIYNILYYSKAFNPSNHGKCKKPTMRITTRPV